MTRKQPHITDSAALNDLLDRYCAGTSSRADEQWLRDLVNDRIDADFPLDGPTARRLHTALAVIAYSMASPRRPKAKARKPRLRIVTAAASVAAAVAVVISLWHNIPAESNDCCIAYVSGRRIDNTAKVMSLMESQLSSIGAEAHTPSGMPANELSRFKDIIQ